MEHTLPALNGGSGYEDEAIEPDFDDLFGDDGDNAHQYQEESHDIAQQDLQSTIDNVMGDDNDNATAENPPDAVENGVREEADVLGTILSSAMGTEGDEFDLNQLNSRELMYGEKADDAVDYEDIGDDDLADEEEPSGTGGPVRPTTFSGRAEYRAAQDDLDDLFEDGGSSRSPSVQAIQPDGKSDVGHARDDADADSVISDIAETGTLAALGARDEDMTEEEQRQYRIQQLLFAGEDQAGTHGIQDMDAWLHIEFPSYDRKDPAPSWNKLLPSKPGKWPSKQSDAKTFKRPRPIRPTKVSLDIEPDQKTWFSMPASIPLPIHPRPDLVHVMQEQQRDALETLSVSASEDELPNGVTMQDIEAMCTGFDTLSHGDGENLFRSSVEPFIADDETDLGALDDEFNSFEHPIKKRRTGLSAHEIVSIHRFELPSFDNPEKTTARLARQVILDLNDPQLLVEEVDDDATRARQQAGRNGTAAGTIKDRLARRFKTSNDATYSLLQQNQKKVRGQLSNMTIDHAMPAIKLQWPYYQVKLSPNQLRNWHRKPMQFKSGIHFARVNKQKRKEFKNKSVREAFTKTRDLSVADNSYTLLMEYSEEHPVMLSQTGMGSKVINYYRKTNDSDATRPKSEIGDTSVLLPNDKSPFQMFGHVDPGESVLALYNSMYRAPLFKQGHHSSDFLVVRETTGMNGQLHYLRNIDYQYIVGQELPSVVVPGTHSRAVTTASKNRLRAISFRLARRKKSHRIRVEEVTRHFPDTNDMQNRQKMKEFMVFNKEHKEWEMRGNAAIPDESQIQKDLRPEDVALLEAMQVGAQYLHDAGYVEDDNDDEDNEKEDKADLSIEQQLAPWKTTKNFIQAVNSKAMLKLYGEGDPSGRGEAFSFIKTSMKGGFKAQGLSVNENVAKGKSDAATGGHTYNVAKQQKAYEESIRDIWDRQKNVLSSQIEPDNIDDEGVDGQLDQMDRNRIRSVTAPNLPAATARRRDDDTGTSFSRRSVNSQAQRYLKIIRKMWNEKEQAFEEREVIESDPQVIRLYVKRKEQQEASSTSLLDLIPTGDPEVDALHKKRLEEELRRIETTKQKKPRRKKNAPPPAGSPRGNIDSPGIDGTDPTTPAPLGGGKNTNATQRKCANCGQVGHIKTNKKLCPLLNGEFKQDDSGQLDDAAFMGAPPNLG